VFNRFPHLSLKRFSRFVLVAVTMGAYIARPLLIYADPMITDDPRCIETAQIIYDQCHLKYEFEQ
jgi:hypothetical protein